MYLNCPGMSSAIPRCDEFNFPYMSEIRENLIYGKLFNHLFELVYETYILILTMSGLNIDVHYVKDDFVITSKNYYFCMSSCVWNDYVMWVLRQCKK